MTLPHDIDPRGLDALHDDPAAWREVIESLALEQIGGGAVQQAAEGTVLVARVGHQHVLKLYPPFLRDHFEFERAMLQLLHGRLSLPTPRLVGSGEREGWPWLSMTQLEGEPLTATWPLMNEGERCRLLTALGALAAEVHALPVASLVALAPDWEAFIATQRSRCVARQQRTGLPQHLLAQVPAFIAGELPQGPAVPLTGEFTPMNLFSSGGALAAMFDFGDGLVGPREYDWLGPLCFLAAGHPARVDAFCAGYGVSIDAPMRLRLMRLMLLHRYSALRLQIAWPGWQDAPSFEALAEQLWASASR